MSNNFLIFGFMGIADENSVPVCNALRDVLLNGRYIADTDVMDPIQSGSACAFLLLTREQKQGSPN